MCASISVLFLPYHYYSVPNNIVRAWLSWLVKRKLGGELPEPVGIAKSKVTQIFFLLPFRPSLVPLTMAAPIRSVLRLQVIYLSCPNHLADDNLWDLA